MEASRRRPMPSGRARPWARRLLETTAVPDVHEQAALITDALAARGAPRHRVRRPRDQYGLPLSTTRAAAVHYVDALDRVLRVQSGAEDALREAVAIDPGFALGHATLALLGYEWGAPVDVAASLRAATTAARLRADERERSLVRVVTELVSRRCQAEDAGALHHIASYPRDALAVSVAVPTIAFSGLAGPPQRTWELVEGLAPSYGADWWYAGLLAFIRQEQERWDDAAALADRALGEVPSAGHAVHARAHVYYETGQHAAGLGWLDPWVASCGRSASHRAHFSWHAALHELALGDLDAVRARYVRELSPPAVSGMRALVDSASLLWRCKVWGAWRSDLPMDEVLDAVPDTLLDRPPTAFAAFHAGLALAAAGDVAALTRLASRAASSGDPTQREVVGPLVVALRALVEGRPGDAADDLLLLRGRLGAVGGSAAQREVVEDTLLAALVDAGRYADARAILAHRLDRRPSRLDREQLARLTAAAR
jgi:hypothetical protein